ncbi:hypothetical protein GC194_04155 [bacterium]|nr:hypothetical protein [bacterium]
MCSRCNQPGANTNNAKVVYNTSMFTTIEPYRLAEATAHNNYVLVDLRSKREFLTDGIAGSVHIPYSSLPDRWQELPQNKEIILYCNDGKMSASARNFLKGHARFTNVASLESGIGSLQIQLKSKKAS